MSSLLKSIGHLAPVAPSNAVLLSRRLGPPGGDLSTSARRSVPVVSRHKPARPRARVTLGVIPQPCSCSYGEVGGSVRIRGQDPRRGLVIYRSIIIPPHAILVRFYATVFNFQDTQSDNALRARCRRPTRAAAAVGLPRAAWRMAAPGWRSGRTRTSSRSIMEKASGRAPVGS